MSSPERKPIAVGDEVRVYNRNGRSALLGGWRGVVAKVGRKLVTINYGHHSGSLSQVDVFRIDTRIVNDNYGHLMFETPEEAELRGRKHAATSALHKRGIDLRLSHSLTLEELEALVAALAEVAAKNARHHD